MDPPPPPQNPPLLSWRIELASTLIFLDLIHNDVTANLTYKFVCILIVIIVIRILSKPSLEACLISQMTL